MTAFLDDLRMQLSWLSEPLADATLDADRLHEEALREPATPEARRIQVEALHGILTALTSLVASARRLADDMSEEG